MGESVSSESDSELNRQFAIALEWLKDENQKFGESLKSLVTYLVAGNIAGVAAVIKLASERPVSDSVAMSLKVGMGTFSVGAVAGILAALFLVGAQWKCVNTYRERVVELYRGSISIEEFSNAPNYYKWAIGSFQVSAIVAFIAGGIALFVWLIFR